ncbi:enoyl-CoA hydratase/isomerase family protein [Caldiplasma sukawensis]
MKEPSSSIIDVETLQDLIQVIVSVSSNEKKQPIIIRTESGSISGYDCSCVLIRDDRFVMDLVNLGLTVGELIREYPAPVVLQINRNCLGAGFELSLLCDAIVCENDTLFGFPESRFNFPLILTTPEYMYDNFRNISLVLSGDFFTTKEYAMYSSTPLVRGGFERAVEEARSLDKFYFKRIKYRRQMKKNEIDHYLESVFHMNKDEIKLKELEKFRSDHFDSF